MALAAVFRLVRETPAVDPVLTYSPQCADSDKKERLFQGPQERRSIVTLAYDGNDDEAPFDTAIVPNPRFQPFSPPPVVVPARNTSGALSKLRQ
jgi:hypothetical protein